MICTYGSINIMIFEDMKFKIVLITILLSKTEIDKPVTEREKETSCGLLSRDYFVLKKLLLSDM